MNEEEQAVAFFAVVLILLLLGFGLLGALAKIIGTVVLAGIFTLLAALAKHHIKW